MSSYSAWRTVQVPAEEMYALLADWGNTGWIPGIEKTEVSRAGGRITRYLYMRGAAPVEETLLSADPHTMTLQYTIVPGELFTLQDYQGTVVVTPAGDGCRVEWGCAFAPGELKPEEAAAIADRNLGFLLDSLCAHIEGRRK